jgi:hypothetical protein
VFGSMSGGFSYLIKEAIKMAFLRPVEYLEHQHLWVQLQAQNGKKQLTFF